MKINGKIIYKINFWISVGFILLISLSITGCFKSSPIEKIIDTWEKSGLPKNSAEFSLNITTPFEGAVFPLDITAPTVKWTYKSSKFLDFVAIIVVNGKAEAASDIITKGEWKPKSEQWKNVKEISKGRNAKIIIIGFDKSEPDKIITGSSISVGISKDSVGAPIFYRAVTLPFSYAVENLNTITWRLGDISSDKEAPIVLKDMPVCGNCHSFSKDGKTLAMDADYANDKGSYVISEIQKEIILSPDKIITWSDYKREDGEQTFGLLSQISPDGRYVASTVKDRSIFVPVDNLMYSQLFFPVKGIIAIYDRITKQYNALPGADDKQYVQSNPNWSPDGKYLLFTKAPYFKSAVAEKSKKPVLPMEVAREFIDRKRLFKYDIYKIAFNNGKGGTAEPVQGASNNGKSNYFARISPDGKWIVFNQANSFMLLQPDSKLYIMPAQGGTPRLMKCNTSSMNSWHSWSPNGKWLVFSSKLNGPYTQLFLTHIDENGNDSPPVLLENLSVPNHAANIPEFVNIKVDNLSKITERFMYMDYYSEIHAHMKLQSGDFNGAIADFDKAIDLDPTNANLFYKRGLAKRETGKLKEAAIDYDISIKLDPKYYLAYYERGYCRMETQNFKGAFDDFSKAIQNQPDFFMAYYERSVARYYLRDFKGSIEDCSHVISVNPTFFQPYLQRGIAYLELNRRDAACDDFHRAMELGSQNAQQLIQGNCGQ